jgi:hypothetical protein
MQKLPVGHSDFKTVIENNYYYVDKSLLIKELLDNGAQALLIPRPRRFGKTLNLSMLRCFFEKTDADTSHLFRHLKIWQAGEEYTRLQGTFPVIFLTFKDVKTSQWDVCLRYLEDIIRKEYERHDYLLTGNVLKSGEKDGFRNIIRSKADVDEYTRSLEKLSDYLVRYHHQKVVLLIDEYDTPIQAGYVNDYYDEVVGFMRNFLSGALKDNPNVEKGVLTGIMRIAKESIFSGLNNLEVYTILSHSFADKFGLREAEVKQMLTDYQVQDQEEAVNQWYNGYIFGDRIIYNPWSIINYLNKPADGFKPYWLHTSDNAIVEQLLTRGGTELKSELESLIRGESIEKPVEENIVFAEIEHRDDLLWSFLLFGGYLKCVHKRADAVDPGLIIAQLMVPNLEVSGIFTRLVKNWFERRVENKKLEMMLQALLDEDLETFEELFAELVEQTLSYWDPAGQDAEKAYQAFAIGLLVWLSEHYEVKSNRESGYGRYDVMLIPKEKEKAGIIIEFKKVNKRRGETKDKAMAKAFQQIEDKKYASTLLERGIQKIRKLAIVFEGKQVWVKEKTDS